MSLNETNCDVCGRFAGKGGSWAHRYDFVAMEPTHDPVRCKRCTETHGPILSNARPSPNNTNRYEGMIE